MLHAASATSWLTGAFMGVFGSFPKLAWLAKLSQARLSLPPSKQRLVFGYLCYISLASSRACLVACFILIQSPLLWLGKFTSFEEFRQTPSARLV